MPSFEENPANYHLVDVRRMAPTISLQVDPNPFLPLGPCPFLIFKFTPNSTERYSTDTTRSSTVRGQAKKSPMRRRLLFCSPPPRWQPHVWYVQPAFNSVPGVQAQASGWKLTRSDAATREIKLEPNVSTIIGLNLFPVSDRLSISTTLCI